MHLLQLSRPVETYEAGDFPDPPRMRDPVMVVCRLLWTLIALNAINVLCTLSLWFR